MRSPYTTFHRVQSTAHQPNFARATCCSKCCSALPMNCPYVPYMMNLFISRFRRDEHTATCWSHVDVVVVTVHVLHVLATLVLVTRCFELSCRDVMSHSSFRDVFCSLKRHDLLHTSSDHTMLAISTVSATLAVANSAVVSNLHISRRGTTHTTSRYVCTLSPVLEA